MNEAPLPEQVLDATSSIPGAVVPEELLPLLEGVPDGLVVQNSTGCTIFVNSAAAHLLGFETPAELLSTPSPEVLERFEVFDEAGQPFPADRLPGRRVLHGEQSATENVRFRVVATGVEQWTQVTAQRVVSPQGDLRSVTILRDITEDKRTERSLRFLAEASALLSSSLDYEATLRSLADLVVPQVADWCAVEITDDEGKSRLVAMAHVDPSRVELAREMRRRFPPAPGTSGGLVEVLRTGRPSLHAELPEEALESIFRGPEHLRLARELGLCSMMIVPMSARGRIIGAIIFVTAESGRRFGRKDLSFAQDLADRAAFAVDNARLYTEAQRAIREKEEESRIKEVLHQIGITLTSELDMDRLVQRLTDEATRLTGAQFGAFLRNVTADPGEGLMLYTLSGAPREVFERFPIPRPTALFGPTYRGECIIRLEDVKKDPRYGLSPPYYGMPEGHLPVSSYLAVPVISRSGSCLGGLFFGHEAPGVFTAQHERLVAGIASQAAVALDNARLYHDLQRNEERLRMALEAGRMGSWEWDVARGRVTWSPALERIHGIPEGSFGGTFAAYQQDIHPDDLDMVLESIQEVLEHQTAHHVVYRIIRPDGQVRWLEGRGMLRLDRQGRPSRLVGVCSDVTEQRETEAREHEIIRTQAAQAEAEAAHHHITRVLRSPLEVVTTTVSTLRQHPDMSEEMREQLLERIERSAETMHRLLEDLLDASPADRLS